MPYTSGYEIMEQIKEIEHTRSLPILVLTAMTDHESRLRALGAGARDFLTKPFDMIEARMRIRSLVEVRLLYKHLTDSYEESDRLLHNILPAHVVQDLKVLGSHTPTRYEDVSVLFTDFEGFTAVAADMPPQQLIQELQVSFTYFDTIIQRRNLQRLKTIGDAYMCAGGMPEDSATHALDCVLAALDMRRFMEGRLAEKSAAHHDYWNIRIGVHTGPLVAGVIGKERFAYDVWGDTVNLASRLESNSEGGRINVSDATRKRIEEFVEITPRGGIPVKHRGVVEMFFVDGLKPEYSMDETGARPNMAFLTRYQELMSSSGT